MAILFNGKQLKNPTPASISNAVAVSSVILGIVIGWLGTQNFIPVHTSTIFQSIGGLILAILNGIKPFFGVQPAGENVPIEKVTAMENVKE